MYMDMHIIMCTFMYIHYVYMHTHVWGESVYSLVSSNKNLGGGQTRLVIVCVHFY